MSQYNESSFHFELFQFKDHQIYQQRQYQNKNKMSKQIDEDIPIHISQPSNMKEESQTYQSVLHKIEPAPTNFNLKQNALEYDIKLGWIPRSQITGPIPLSFNSPINDQVIEKYMKSVLYLGYRPHHSFELHQKYYDKGKNYPFYQFHLCKSQFLERFFKKYYSQYEFNGCRRSQTIGQSPIQFNSEFEGGNLDAVYYQEDEYRLLLRVDTNTQGHCNYYNFRIRVKVPGKYIFRIMNINKQKSLYQRGMRPYVRFRKGGRWSEYKQSQSKVSFENSPLCQSLELKYKLKSMKFQYQFSAAGEEYEFSYSIPFPYSNLLRFLNQLRNSPFMHFTKLCHTLSGVEIPLLTITGKDREQSQQQQKQPFVVVITGRVHPSESNSSHIINGLINSLLGNSQSAKYLRKNVIFKIIPMINPDGVIAGNTRTSFAGKDLNRKYYKNLEFVFPQIIGVMDYVAKLKSKYHNKLLYIIDVHGHSARKNSFFYGPQYSIIDLQYAKCRLLPRIFSQKTDVFRYYSCKYKVAGSKEYSARGYFNSIGIRTYTHQTSMHCHWNFAKRKDEPFTRKSLEKLGQSLIQSIADYVKTQSTVNPKHLKQEILEKQKQNLNTRQKGIDFQDDSQNSQQMASSKDDSESEDEDFQGKRLQQFYNRINQNKEYFIQELQAMEKQSPDKKDKDKSIKNQEKKKKKTQTNLKTETNQQQQKVIQKREKIEEQLITKKSVEKIDWASKVAYPQKKKFYQQYTKMSSVIFGSSIPPSFFTSNQYKSTSNNSNLANFNETKYTIKCLDAQFKSTTVKYPSPEHKIYKSKQIKRQMSLSQSQTASKQVEKQKSLEKTGKLTLQKFMELKRQSDIESEILHQPKPISKSQMERLLSRPSEYCLVKSLPVCSVDLQMQRQQEEKLIKKLNGSLKILTRKKSIKSIRQSEQSLPRRNSQSFKSSLTKKLPSINTLLNKF